LAKTGITVLVFYFIVVKTRTQGFDPAALEPLVAVERAWILGVVLLLMPLNWALETMKWQLLIHPVHSVSFQKALTDVLMGLSLNWVLPFTLGDYLGRVWSYDQVGQASKAVVINRATSFFVTGWAGLTGVYGYLRMQGLVGVDVPVFFVFYGLVSIVLMWVVFVFLFRYRIPFFLTVLRYLVFMAPLVLLFRWSLPVDVSVSTLIMGVAWIFLIRSSIPSLFGALGLREASALLFFDGLGHPAAILVPGLIVWFVNLVIPSLVGLALLLKYKVKLAT